MYNEFGYALCVVERKDDGAALGVCGVVKRDGLAMPDLGFAFLDAYTKQGYAYEAAAASVTLARDILHIPTLLALALPANERSIRLLARLGFTAVGPIRLAPEDPLAQLFELRLLKGAA